MVRKVLWIAEQNQPDATDLQPPPSKRMRCVLCPRSKDRKTPMTCSKCRKSICKQHAEQPAPHHWKFYLKEKQENNEILTVLKT
nr:unnamed protein product [Callosobruchus chinensis]